MGYKNILITLDGSKLAETALEYLSVIAEPQSSVHLLTVVTENHVTESATILATTMNPDWALVDLASVSGIGSRNSQAVNLCLEYLDTIKTQLVEKGFQVTTEAFPGEVVDTIVEVAQRGFDALLIATHGRTGFGRLVLGSVTEGVMHKAPCPVVVIPVRDPAKKHLEGASKTLPHDELRVLVSLDGTPTSEIILPQIERLIVNRKAKVILLRAGNSPDYDTLIEGIEPHVKHSLSLEISGDTNALLGGVGEKYIRDYLDDLTERFKNIGVSTVSEVGFSKPTEEILFFSDLYRVDLIAMATHGRTGIARLIRGSVTDTVLHRTPCPMMIVREDDLASEPTSTKIAANKTGKVMRQEEFPNDSATTYAGRRN